jgi:uncharacterized protein (TIRG00374 family)
VALTEKALELVALLIVVTPVAWLLPGLPSWVARSLWFLVALGGFVVVDTTVVLWIAARREKRHQHDPSHPRWERFQRFVAGVQVLRTPSGVFGCVGISVAAWCIDLVEVLLVLKALHVEVPWPAALLVLLTINMAVALPSTPASVGAFEIGAVVGLQVLGVDKERALAFALIYHALQVLPLALVGLFELRLLGELRAETHGGAIVDEDVNKPPPEDRS